MDINDIAAKAAATAIAQIRTGHLMVRDASEWDAMALALSNAYQAKDDELIEQRRPSLRCLGLDLGRCRLSTNPGVPGMAKS